MPLQGVIGTRAGWMKAMTRSNEKDIYIYGCKSKFEVRINPRNPVCTFLGVPELRWCNSTPDRWVWQKYRRACVWIWMEFQRKVAETTNCTLYMDPNLILWWITTEWLIGGNPQIRDIWSQQSRTSRSCRWGECLNVWWSHGCVELLSS